MPLSYTIGKVAALYLASGASGAVTNKAMQEVNLSADSTDYRPRYSVYEPVDPAFRHLDDAVIPVFEYKLGGTGSWLTIPGTVRVEYPDCRIYLGTPLVSADTVQMTSANVITPTMVAGVENMNFDANWETIKKMFLRDTAKRTILKNKQWTASANLTMVNTCATLTTALGTNKDITYTHKSGGTAGNDISIEYINPAGGTVALSIVVTGNAIVVTLGYATGAVTTTALALVELINRNALVKELGITADVKAGETGAGLLDTFAHTHLSGGLEPIDYTGINGAQGTLTAIAEFYADYDNDIRWVDYAKGLKASLKINADDVNTVVVNFESRGGQNCGPFLRKA
jgi:hypothetical protein